MFNIFQQVIQDVASKTNREWWMLGTSGSREICASVRHDEDDDNYISQVSWP